MGARGVVCGVGEPKAHPMASHGEGDAAARAAPQEASSTGPWRSNWERPGLCLCRLPESVKSLLSEITNPGAFTTPLPKSTFHPTVSFCLPSA